MKFSFKFAGRFRSWKHAWQGLWNGVIAQNDKWIYALLTTASVGTAFYMNITRERGCLIAFAWAVVWIVSAMNTAFQYLVNTLFKEHQPVISKAKDFFAAAVLIALIAAVGVTVTLLIPLFHSSGPVGDPFITQ